MDILFSFLEPWLVFFSEDPVVLSIQAGLIVVVSLLIFLVFYTAKDIVLRSTSFAATLFSILLVALLPLIGFLLYILLRPTLTLREKQLHKEVHDLWSQRQKHKEEHAHQKKNKKPQETPAS